MPTTEGCFGAEMLKRGRSRFGEKWFVEDVDIKALFFADGNIDTEYQAVRRGFMI